MNGARPTVLVWRKDWLEKVGIEKIPSTIEEFETAIRAFKEQDPDGNGKNDTFGFSNTCLLYTSMGLPTGLYFMLLCCYAHLK